MKLELLEELIDERTRISKLYDKFLDINLKLTKPERQPIIDHLEECLQQNTDFFRKLSSDLKVER